MPNVNGATPAVAATRGGGASLAQRAACMGATPRAPRAAPSTHTAMFETLRVGDLTIVAATPADDAPPRPPLLLVHGFMVGGWFFVPYQRFLAERGWPSWAVTLRGH